MNYIRTTNRQTSINKLFERQGQNKTAQTVLSNTTVRIVITIITIKTSFLKLNYNNNAFSWFQ